MKVGSTLQRDASFEQYWVSVRVRDMRGEQYFPLLAAQENDLDLYESAIAQASSLESRIQLEWDLGT